MKIPADLLAGTPIQNKYNLRRGRKEQRMNCFGFPVTQLYLIFPYRIPRRSLSTPRPINWIKDSKRSVAGIELWKIEGRMRRTRRIVILMAKEILKPPNSGRDWRKNSSDWIPGIHGTRWMFTWSLKYLVHSRVSLSLKELPLSKCFYSSCQSGKRSGRRRIRRTMFKL